MRTSCCTLKGDRELLIINLYHKDIIIKNCSSIRGTDNLESLDTAMKPKKCRRTFNFLINVSRIARAYGLASLLPSDSLFHHKSLMYDLLMLNVLLYIARAEYIFQLGEILKNSTENTKFN